MVKTEVISHQLRFVKPALTSRNVFRERRIFLVKVWDSAEPEKIGWGEAAPLEKLSIDDVPEYEDKLREMCRQLEEGVELQDLDLEQYPSILFGFETALNDLKNGEDMKVFEGPFFEGKPIEINGLVWMGDSATMLEEALEKASSFSTIKFKVGALDFDEECRMLEAFRKRFSQSQKTIRLDANCAFAFEDAEEKLRELSRFGIHSIEQPIATGQWEALEELQAKGAIDIALDEELIGLNPFEVGEKLLLKTGVPYLILKPNLLGGFVNCDEWVRLCSKHSRAWWATSALEGNVGLNAIAQWVSQYKNELPQGLGTGSLFGNNIESPLTIDAGHLHYSPNKSWQLPR